MSKKNASPWFQCDKCATNLLNKDIEAHSGDCPPNLQVFKYGFVRDEVLFGNLDIKTNEDIKNVTPVDKNFLVFLSQAAIQLTNLAIGEWCKLQANNNNPIARMVWPTTEKTLTSILLTKNTLELNFPNTKTITVSKLNTDITPATQITIVALNSPKNMEISPELNTRICKSFQGKYFTAGNKFSVLFYGKTLKFEIKTINCGNNLEEKMGDLKLDNKFYVADERTKWRLYKTETDFQRQDNKPPLIKKIAGLAEEIEEIRHSIKACFANSQSRAILLHGNPGTGKTLLANAMAEESGACVIKISAPDLYSKYSGDVEGVIKGLFEEAIEGAPSVIVLDEVDLLCPYRSSRITDAEKRIVSTLLTMFDYLCELGDSKVFVIATTNKLEVIDPAFRRFGRLDREVEVPTPNPNARCQIIRKILEDYSHGLSIEEINDVGFKTHGFVGADLVSLCSRANLNASRRPDSKILSQDFKYALIRVRPSAMREVQIEVPNIKWSDIGGQDNLKLILRQAVEWPLKHADCFIRLGITPPKGVLMYGPPGCSKTMIAKALATESGLNFLSIKGPELFSKWVGESERAVREVFRKARQVAPSIIFFDEIDALGGERSSGSTTSVQERVLAQLLTELDGVTPLGDVTVLAATNRPDRIDKALLRPGRLDRIVYVPLPDENTRREIFKIKLQKMPVSEISIEDLVQSTNNYSGAEVNAICHEAAMMALEEDLNIQTISRRHFDKALTLVKPRTPKSMIELYEDYAKIKV